MVFVCFVLSSCLLFSRGWSPTTTIRRRSQPTRIHSVSSSWSVADDWEGLSSKNRREEARGYVGDFDTEEWDPEAMDDIDDGDFDFEMEDEIDIDNSAAVVENSREDEWIQTTLEDFLSEQPATDSDELGVAEESNSEEKGYEISRMVRCNEEPTELLYETGRAIKPLSKAQRDDVNQLLDPHTTEPTEFFHSAISTIFNRYAAASESKESTMNDKDVAAWMRQCLGEQVTKFDPRVRSILRRGAVAHTAFHEIYVTAAKLRPAAVWRDLRAHGILGPNEAANRAAAKAIEKSSVLGARDLESFVDECELAMNDDENDRTSGTGDRYGESSYAGVDLVPGTDHPLYIRDGEFGTNILANSSITLIFSLQQFL